MLQRGRALSSAEIRPHPAARTQFARLQRGRALSSAEIAMCCLPLRPPNRASTGPRSFERGDGLAVGCGTAKRNRFNGAALFRARRFQPAQTRVATPANASTDGAPGASTGPRSFERGDLAKALHLNPRHASLQRGRALSSAEMRHRPPVRSRCLGASTGPRSFERGDEASRAAAEAAAKASTGPRSFERGDAHGGNAADPIA